VIPRNSKQRTQQRKKNCAVAASTSQGRVAWPLEKIRGREGVLVRHTPEKKKNHYLLSQRVVIQANEMSKYRRGHLEEFQAPIFNDKDRNSLGISVMGARV